VGTEEFAVVDLFAGPGGLAEGFASVRAPQRVRPFSIALSVEKEVSAHATLLLRSFLRQFEKFPKEYYQFLNGEREEPDWKALYPSEWKAATKEALNLELGSPSAIATINARLDSIRDKYQGNVVLIGGPPCQAYSLVGRARNRGIADYNASEDHRHFLYQEYIRILQRLRPAAFVMENVKGMLSSKVDGEGIFDKVLSDLRSVGKGQNAYQLIALAPCERSADELHSTDFVVRAEDFGVPQARHRVIVLGIRKDLAGKLDKEFLSKGLLNDRAAHATVRDVLQGMPRLRSGLSKSEDSEEAWRKTVIESMGKVLALPDSLPRKQAKIFRLRVREYTRILKNGISFSRTGTKPGIGTKCPAALRSWLMDPLLKRLPNSETRGHMASDLARYFFAAVYGEVTGVSPKASHYPRGLAPKHQNWSTGKFADRFRVQLWEQASTTVTCHISKDGHYFIHPDPVQCRSLTVREAARLQTFPDNYYFKGNRTQQYVQVGNAVPPYLAKHIAEALYSILIQGIIPARASLDEKQEKHKFSGMQFSTMAANK
jgi:DNA (cytosine-5)-methyltransferase 1